MTMILERFPSGPIETNSYLLGCPHSKKAAVIDLPFDSADLIMERANELGLSISMILLTHSHWDHVAEVSIVKEKLNIPVYIHEEDIEHLQNPPIGWIPKPLKIKGVTPDHLLSDGEILTLGECKIQVIHTPGHSPGGVCFYIPHEKILISGDTLFRGTIGRLDLPTGEPERMWKSLKKLAVLPPETKVYPGHGEATTIQREHWLAEAEQKFS